jgi:hypothetical protein
VGGGYWRGYLSLRVALELMTGHDEDDVLSCRVPRISGALLRVYIFVVEKGDTRLAGKYPRPQDGLL